MRARDPNDPSLFEESTDTSSESWSVNVASLNDALLRLQSSQTIIALRREMANLNSELQNPQSVLRSPTSNGDAIALPSSYLSEELKQIAASHTLERANYYIKRLAKSITESRVSDINDINLNRWKEYSDIYVDSLWNIDRRENSGVHSAEYWGNFVPQIPYQMMRRYTKKGDWVLDTFAGLGTTLIEGQRLGRNTLGIELQDTVATKARQLVGSEPNPHDVACEVTTGDSASINYTEILRRYSKKSVQLVVMHPPYFDIIKFSDDSRDLSNALSLDAFLASMARIAKRAAAVLDRGRYMALVIGDKYSKGEWIPLGFLTMNAVLKQGLMLKSIVVKNFDDTTGKRQRTELWRYRALVGGFYIFKHEYVFVFKKP